MINACVIDTDVLSYTFKSDTRASLYYQHLKNNLGLISFMTLAELRQWSLVRNWGGRRLSELDTFLSQYHVIHSDENICSIWSEIRRDALRFGRNIDIADAWIAATAILYEVPLITHNRDHYVNVSGLVVISER